MALLTYLKERVKQSGRNDVAAWTDSRPEICELLRLEAAALIAEKTGAPLYVVHLSIGSGVKTIERFLDRGVKVYAETCPHYLLLHKNMPQLEGWAKVCPPLRTEADQEELWAALQRGLVLTMGSDHCPYTRAAKERDLGKANFWGALPGFSNGMEHLLPLMWTHGVHKRRISVEQLAKICSENTARLFGLYPRKGALIPGADADIIIVDPERGAVIDETFYHTRSADWSVFFGERVRGMCIFTMVRGKVMYKDGKVTEEYGHGKFIPAGL
jgi:dihydropyrimidinase/dihydroorotase